MSEAVPGADATAPDAALVEAYDGVLVDLDGVVYVGPDAVAHAVEALNRAHGDGRAWAFVTNNASRPAVEVAKHLTELGLAVGQESVVTSAQVAAALVRDRFKAGSRVLVVGGPGVAIAVREVGLEPTHSADDDPVAVVQGFGKDVSWRHLLEATVAVRQGALWVATNTDVVIPTERGTAPGNGTFVAAVREATQVEPLVAGKPEPVAFSSAADRIGSRRPLVIGDRLDTDIGGGNAAGFDTVLVLTGVHGPRHLLACPASQRPVHVVEDLRGLFEPTPVVHADDGSARSGQAVVELLGDELRPIGGGGHPVDLLRAALCLGWAAADAGRPVRVSEALTRRWSAFPD